MIGPRKFKHQIFMGNGDDSTKQCVALLERVKDGLSLLSGLQQGGAERGTRLYDESIQDLADVVLDVASALGVKVQITGEMPYEEAQ